MREASEVFEQCWVLINEVVCEENLHEAVGLGGKRHETGHLGDAFRHRGCGMKPSDIEPGAFNHLLINVAREHGQHPDRTHAGELDLTVDDSLISVGENGTQESGTHPGSLGGVQTFRRSSRVSRQ